MQTRKALGNLINKYKAVLKKCYFLNKIACIFPSAILAGSLALTLTLAPGIYPTNAMAATNIVINGDESITKSLETDGTITTDPTFTGSATLTLTENVSTGGTVNIGNTNQAGNVDITLAGSGNSFTSGKLTVKADQTQGSGNDTQFNIGTGVDYTVNGGIELDNFSSTNIATLNVNSGATLNTVSIVNSTSQTVSIFKLDGRLNNNNTAALIFDKLSTTMGTGAEIFTEQLTLHSGSLNAGTTSFTIDGAADGSVANTFKVLAIHGANIEAAIDMKSVGGVATGTLYLRGGQLKETTVGTANITRSASEFKSFDDSSVGGINPTDTGIVFAQSSTSTYYTENLTLKNDQALNLSINSTVKADNLTVQDAITGNTGALTIEHGTVEVTKSLTATTITLQGNAKLAADIQGNLKFSGTTGGTIDAALEATGDTRQQGSSTIEVIPTINVVSGNWIANENITINDYSQLILSEGDASASLDLTGKKLTTTVEGEVSIRDGGSLTLDLNNIGSITGTTFTHGGTVAADTFNVENGGKVFINNTHLDLTFLEYEAIIDNIKTGLDTNDVNTKGIYELTNVTLGDMSGATVENAQNIGGLEGKEIAFGTGANAGKITDKSTLNVGYIKTSGGTTEVIDMGNFSTLILNGDGSTSQVDLTPGGIQRIGTQNDPTDRVTINLSNGRVNRGIDIKDSFASVTLENITINGISIVNSDTVNNTQDNTSSRLTLKNTTVNGDVIQDGAHGASGSGEDLYSTLTSFSNTNNKIQGLATTEHFIAQINSTIDIGGTVTVKDLDGRDPTKPGDDDANEGTAIMHESSKVSIGGDYIIEKQLTLAKGATLQVAGELRDTATGTANALDVENFNAEGLTVDIGTYDNNEGHLNTTGENSDFTFGTLTNTASLALGEGSTFTVKESLTGTTATPNTFITLEKGSEFIAGDGTGTMSTVTVHSIASAYANSTGTKVTVKAGDTLTVNESLTTSDAVTLNTGTATQKTKLTVGTDLSAASFSAGDNGNVDVTGAFKTTTTGTTLGGSNTFQAASVETASFTAGSSADIDVTGAFTTTTGAAEFGANSDVNVAGVFTATTGTTLGGSNTFQAASVETASFTAGSTADIDVTGAFQTTTGAAEFGANSDVNVAGVFTAATGTTLGDSNTFKAASVNTAFFNAGSTADIDVTGAFTTTTGAAKFGANSNVDVASDFTSATQLKTGADTTMNVLGNLQFGNGRDISEILGTITIAQDLSVRDNFTQGNDSANGVVAVSRRATFNNKSGLLDPVWAPVGGVYDPAGASQLAIMSTAADGLDGNIAVGRNSHMSFGTDNNNLLTAILASYSNGTIKWGLGGITAAVGLFGTTSQHIDGTTNTGTLIVDGSLDSMAVAGTVATFSSGTTAKYAINGTSAGITNITPSGDAIFADGSLLVINQADKFNSTANFALTGDGAITVDTGARLHVIGAVAKQDIYVADFASGIFTGWNESDVTSASPLIDPVIVKNPTEGTYIITFNQVPVATVFPCFDPSTQSLVDAMVAQYGTVTTTSNAGVNFVNSVLSDTSGFGSLDPSGAVKIIESAAQPAALTGVARTTMDVSQTLSSAITARTSQAKLGDNGKDVGQMHLAQNGTVTAGANIPEMEEGLGLWVAPQFSNLSSFGNMCNGCYDNGYSTDFGGMTVGADYTFNENFKAGLALGLGAGNSITKGEMAKTENSFYYWGVNAYASYHVDNFTVMGDIGYAQTINEISQRLPSSIGMGNNSADLNAYVFSVGLTAEYVIETDFIDIIPHVGVRYMSVVTDAYDVENMGTIFEVDSDQQSVWYFPVGITFQKDVAINENWTFTPRIDLGFVAAAGDLHVNSKVSIPGLNHYTDLELQNVDGFAFKGGLGFDISGENLKFTLTYNIQASEHETGHGLFGVLSYEF